jgi:hypothetical protein
MARAQAGEPYPAARKAYPVIRQSTLSTFDSCGLSAHFESTYRQGWSTHPQARGQVFHRVAAECLRVMHRQGEQSIPVDAALAILHDKLRQEDVDRECPACGSRKIRPGIRHGMRTCESCRHRFPTDLANLPMAHVKDLYWVVIKWAHDNAWDIANLADVEHRLSAKVSYPNPAGGFVERTVTGQLDALLVEGDRDDHAVVLDWKDMWRLPAKTEVSFEGYFQQRLYGWLVMRNYRAIEKVTLREFYVRFSQPREVTIWRDDLDSVEQEFAALVERFDRAVHDNAYTPTPGNHCSWCLRPGACPILPEARAEGRIRTAAEAEKMARQLVVAEALSGQAKGALQAYANLHGPIPIRDAKGKRALGFREHARTERPSREALEAAIRAAGPDGLKVDDLYQTSVQTKFEQHVPPRVKPSDEDVVTMAKLEGALAAARAERERS